MGIYNSIRKMVKKDLSFLIQKYLNPDLISETNILNYEYVLEIKKRFFNGESYLYNRIWNLIVLNKFLKENIC